MGKIGTWLFGALLTLIGATLLIGGVQLVVKGGSFYYAAAGLAVLASAVGLVRRAKFGPYAYAGLLIVTILWSIAEAGLDGWALTPRLIGPAVLGLLFLAPAKAAGVKRWWVGGPVLASFLLVGFAFTRAEMSESGLAPAAKVTATNAPADWRHWGNGVEGTKFAAFDQINTDNVGKLELAWRYDSDVKPGKLVSLEAAPLAVDGRLYMCQESGAIDALDQQTGKRIWSYRGLPKDSPFLGWKCRGVAYYETPAVAAPIKAVGKPAKKAAKATPLQSVDCKKRLFLTTPGGQLIAIDADTGRQCSKFANNGIADLHLGMGPMKDDAALPTSPPTLVNGVVVVGQSISDMGSRESPSGVIRGYDAQSGALIWAWDAGRPGQTQLKPGEIYTPDTPNAWGVFSGDEKLGLVYVGTGNAPPDYYSVGRSKVADEFTDSVVAIDVATGQMRWYFRTVHHDIWDYDIASQPVAVDLKDGTPALIVSSKRGELFMLDRRTGKSLDPIVNKPVPQGSIEGGWLSPTQPFPVGFPPVSGDDLREQDMWGLTPLDQMWCRMKFRDLDYRGQFTPITTKEMLLYPGAAGGINWGSVSVDPQRGLLVVNSLHFSQIMQLVPRPKGVVLKAGYEGGKIVFPQEGMPYYATQSPFLSPVFAPCQEPPYGKISVFDIETRKLLWSKPLGTAAGSGPLGQASKIPLRMGAPNLGGSLTTAGGLVFIAAAQDHRLRAFDIANGKEVWSANLPAIGAANPISYVGPNGKQYVVIAAGGHFALPGPKASAIMAFALPDK